MFHLLLTACLAADPTACAERLLPAPMPEDRAACEAAAPTRIAAFTARHDLRPQGWVCRDTTRTLSFDQIAPGVFVHTGVIAPLSPENGGEIANLSFIVTDRVTVLDAGGSRAEGEALYASIRALTAAPITTVILTHGHPDHSYGADVLRAAGAQVIGHHRLPEFMSARADTWAQSIPRQIGIAPMIGAVLALPDRVIEGQADLEIGAGRILRLTAEPTAHTSADLTALDMQTGTLFTGDLVFHGLTPVLDGSLKGWLGWLNQPAPKGVRRIVSGHGAGPFSWADGTAPLRAYLEGLAAETRAEIAAGTPMSAAVARIGADLRQMPDGSEWAGFDEMHPRNATAAYAELEWE